MSSLNATGEVSPEMAKTFRTCIGILLYLAPDLPHCQHVVRHLAMYSTQPTIKSVTVFKHLVSYLAGHESICISLKWKGRNVGLFQRRARRINYGDLHRFRLGVGQTNTAFCFMFNDLPGRWPFVFSFTNSEAGILSSAEAEVYACSSGASDGLLLARLVSWVSGFKTTIYLFTDSSGARGILQRQGVGRVRHLSCRILWLQDLICNGSIKFCNSSNIHPSFIQPSNRDIPSCRWAYPSWIPTARRLMPESFSFPLREN